MIKNPMLQPFARSMHFRVVIPLACLSDYCSAGIVTNNQTYELQMQQSQRLNWPAPGYPEVSKTTTGYQSKECGRPETLQESAKSYTLGRVQAGCLITVTP